MSRQSGREVALYRDIGSGERFVALGNRTGVAIPENSRLIAHTQPGTGAAAVRASVADEAALARLNQRSSVIINDAGDAATRFRPTARGTELAQREAGDVRLHAPDDALYLGKAIVSDAAERTFLSLGEFASLPKTGSINPSLIRFSQDSAKATFKHPFGSVDDFATGLANKLINPSSVSPIRIVEKDGMIFTLDINRQYAFQKAGVEISYQKLDAVPEDQLFKFSTVNNGTSIVIRRKGQ
jgi:hypothetical protein